MKLLIGGASGFVGTTLSSFLQKEGHSITKLTRKQNALSQDEVIWDPDHALLDPKSCEGFDGVINLAGENIASGRWTEERKKKIKESRIKSTQLLVDRFSKLKSPPKVLVNASAIGFYGSQGSTILTEASSAGSGFLAEVCQEWEKEAEKASQYGVRVVCARFGVVLSEKGGALKKMAQLFKLYLGGVIGSGKQYMSWVALDDVVRVIQLILDDTSLAGPVNVVAPHPVQNREFTEFLGAALHRPTLCPLPEFAAKLAFGQMAEEMLLSSTRVMPEKLEQQGYSFIYSRLEDAFQHLLK